MFRVLIGSLSLCMLLVGIPHDALARTETMTASWYGPGLQGNTMANGDTFSMYDPTIVAHKKLPFGTCLRLTNPTTGKTIIGEVQDRGPFVAGRELDLSKAAAAKLGFIKRGEAELTVTTVSATLCRS